MCVMSAETIAIIDALAAAGETAAIRIVCKVLGDRNTVQSAVAAAEDEQRRAVQRTPAAERQRKRRARLKRCPETADLFVSNTEADFADAAIAQTSERSHSVTVTPHKKKESISVKESDSDSKKKYKSATLCPPNWQPTEAHHATAAAKGLNREKVEQLAGEMRAWSEANRHRDCAYKADWDAAFSGWIARQKPVLTVVEGGRPVIKPQREMTAEEFEREMQIASERGKAHRKILFGG